MIKKITLFNTPIAAISLNETVELVDNAIVNNHQLHHIAVNVAKIVHMQTDKQLYDSVVSADIINADGMPLVWVSKLLGKAIPERVTGVDLMQSLVELASEKHYKIYFLGAKEEVVKMVVEHYSEKYSPKIVAGYRNGYFSESEEKEVASQIALSGANILFVAITSPKKENFLFRNKDLLSNVNFFMGVGGSFDVVSGVIKRAPIWMQRVGLEWLFRIIQEPKRMWKRYLITNTLFLFYLIKEVINRKS
ncbi:MAG: WecB/TagA/CpsF family glycosyltransferase [Bacteroidia bacterium]|nr:WecB/TagA/CpsF family glycosyltransferase [Bacteroidia bacterium]